jgi:hypothetical protein
VKLLGTVSRKGRVYPPAVMAKALPMYEGMRVNVDHVDPGQRRSLRDRIGLVKNVTLKEDGLCGGAGALDSFWVKLRCGVLTVASGPRHPS